MDQLTCVRVSADLERTRSKADAFADALAQEHIDGQRNSSARDWFASLGNGKSNDEIQAFLRAEGDDGDLDDLIEIEKVRHAQRFFETYGLHISAGLLLKSLPDSYVCARGAQVLYLTGEFISDPARRVRETAQMLIVMVSPDPSIRGDEQRSRTTLHAGGAGARTARKIRLFHALVRQLFTLEPAGDPTGEPDGHLELRWKERQKFFGGHGRPSLGVPICQEDQLGTLFTFTVSMFEALERLGVPFDDDDRDAWFHVWDVIGRHLGVGVESAFTGRAGSHVLRPDTDPIFSAPLTPAISAELMTVIRQRHREASHEGKILTNALLKEVEGPLPRALKPLPASLLQYLAGSEVQQLLGVRSGGWGQYWANRLMSGRRLGRLTLGRPTRLPGGELSAMMAREVLQMFTEQGNFNVFDSESSRQFELSDRLRRTWGINDAATLRRPPGHGFR